MKGVRAVQRMLTVWIGLLLCWSPVVAAERDTYQNIDPALVAKVNIARDKQQTGQDLDGAEAILTDVLRQKSDYYRALYNLGLIYQAKNELPKAIETLEKAKAIRDNQHLSDNTILNSLGWTYLMSGDLKRAEVSLKEAYEKKSENKASNARLLNNLGSLYLQKGETNESRKYLAESISAYPENSANAKNLLKLVDEYEQRQNQTQTPGELWTVFGTEQKKGGKWAYRHFSIENDTQTRAPQKGDIVTAKENVYVRTKYPVWDNDQREYVYPPIVGYIKPGDRLQVTETQDAKAINPRDKAYWFWIQFNRLPKQ